MTNKQKIPTWGGSRHSYTCSCSQLAALSPACSGVMEPWVCGRLSPDHHQHDALKRVARISERSRLTQVFCARLSKKDRRIKLHQDVFATRMRGRICRARVDSST